MRTAAVTANPKLNARRQTLRAQASAEIRAGLVLAGLLRGKVLGL